MRGAGLQCSRAGGGWHRLTPGWDCGTPPRKKVGLGDWEARALCGLSGEDAQPVGRDAHPLCLARRAEVREKVRRAADVHAPLRRIARGPRKHGAPAFAASRAATSHARCRFSFRIHHSLRRRRAAVGYNPTAADGLYGHVFRRADVTRCAGRANTGLSVDVVQLCGDGSWKISSRAFELSEPRNTLVSQLHRRGWAPEWEWCMCVCM